SIASAAEGDELACNMIDGYEDVTLSSDLVFSTTPVSGSKMTGHADNGKIYFWGRVNGATATECEFTLTTSSGDVTVKVPAANVFKNNAFNIASSFAPALPSGALKGVFSVSDTKKVYFSKGNLYADRLENLYFEANQYSSASSFDESHISHFFYSEDARGAIKGHSFGEEYLFCDESHKVSVDRGEAIYYALSKEEWQYLFITRADASSKVGFATVGGVEGIIILPDTFTDPMKNNGNAAFAPKSSTGWTANIYTIGGNWEAMETAGAVFLPAAGFRSGSDFLSDVYGYGYYCSSTVIDCERAYYMYFTSDGVNTYHSAERDRHGHSIRLVTDVK
ncbi:MAG: hypothetical protein KBT44_02760, partial [Bacteroidales bacterium]|nr:hypothetical protein [Candidatus Equibacterium intestinale]